MSISKKISGLFIIIILLIAIRLLTFGITKPFWGHHDWNSVVYSNVAANYNRYGYFATKLGQVTNHDNVPKNLFNYITHYPPLLPILISFSFRLFGQSEASSRMVVVVFSLILVFYLYKIGRELHSRLLGIFAASATAFLPIFIYFGKLPVHDTIVPAISTLSFWLYLKLIKSKDDKYYWLLIISLILAGFVNWSGFYLTIALIFHQFICKTEPEIKKKVLLLISLSILIFAIQLLHIHFLGIKPDKTFDNLLVRIDPYITSNLYGFTLLKYIKQELLFLRVYFTLPLFIGALTFLFIFTLSFFRKHLNFSTCFIFTLFMYGIIQILVFEQLSFIHDYMIYYLLPFMVLATSYTIFILPKKFRRTIFFPIVLITILAFILFSRFKYTQTLLATSEHKRGYDAAKIINSQTISGQKSFIASNSYKEFDEVFIGYYSDRSVDYGEKLPPGFDKTFTLIIRPKDHDPLNMTSKEFLDKNYPKFENESFIWYKIN